MITETDVITALRCCTNVDGEKCGECPANFNPSEAKIRCKYRLLEFALESLIYLQADKKALISGQETLYAHITQIAAENEELKRVNTIYERALNRIPFSARVRGRKS